MSTHKTGRLFGSHRQMARTQLSAEQILIWADRHRKYTGRWPSVKSGRVRWARGENWRSVDNALRRGLRDGDSLARLLARRRGARNQTNIPSLTLEHILAWADAHHAPTGEWPIPRSGPVLGAPGQTWAAIECALRSEGRGLKA